MSDAASIEWFGQLAYMSFLLGPNAPPKAKHWSLLSEQQREWFRVSAQHAIADTNSPSKTDDAGPKSITSFGGELEKAPKESPLAGQKATEKGDNSFEGELRFHAVERCGDCNGTGADYDPDVRAFACATCGGSGMVELRKHDTTDDFTEKRDAE